MTSIDDILSQVTSGYAETAISAGIHDNKITGTFVGSDGGVFDYELTPDYIEYGESHLDSEYVNDYFTGILTASGVEYHGDSAYDYWKGRTGKVIKKDAKTVTCKKGGVPCRGRCLPQGQKCRINQAEGSTTKNATGNLMGAGILAAGLLGAAAGATVQQNHKNKMREEDKKNAAKMEENLKGSADVLNRARKMTQKNQEQPEDKKPQNLLSGSSTSSKKTLDPAVRERQVQNYKNMEKNKKNPSREATAKKLVRKK